SRRTAGWGSRCSGRWCTCCSCAVVDHLPARSASEGGVSQSDTPPSLALRAGEETNRGLASPGAGPLNHGRGGCRRQAAGEVVVWISSNVRGSPFGSFGSVGGRTV